MRRPLREIAGDNGAAVAPIIALSLFGLIAVGGIAFDYARMATLDTELQDAADQAALAAASQLDGQTGACSRAAAAARNMVSNQTRMARGSVQVTVANEPACDGAGNVRFFQDLDKSTAATTDANAKFVQVQVDPREAFFAFTPIVGMMRSGTKTGIAYAGMDSAICKTPPVMICNPQETAGSQAFDLAAMVGKGLKLVSVGNGNGSWAPGNFGYLNTGAGSNGAPGLREDLGWQSTPGDCISATGVSTKPGASVSVTDALNTRFDIYDSNTSCPAGGSCGASINSVKDVARAANANGTNACKLHNQGWNEGTTATAYEWGTIPSSATTALPTTTIPSVMGHPRDMCHAVPGGTAGECTGPVGDGNWDRDAYFRTNYVRSGGTRWTHAEWMTNTGLGAAAKRYDVYKWEMDHRGTSVDGVTVLASRKVSGNGASAFTSYGSPQCSAGQGYGSGVVPSSTVTDRRVFSVAIVNCIANNVSGNSTGVPVKEWIDIFLVEPSIARGSVTNAGDVYVEVVGRSQNATDDGAVQLVKKSVPYLIE